MRGLHPVVEIHRAYATVQYWYGPGGWDPFLWDVLPTLICPCSRMGWDVRSEAVTGVEGTVEN
jgi:hypothetical protein